jgi:hypothetical protein
MTQVRKTPNPQKRNSFAGCNWRQLVGMHDEKVKEINASLAELFEIDEELKRVAPEDVCIGVISR